MSKLEKPYDAAVAGISAGEVLDSGAASESMRCTLPGCAEPHTSAAGTVALAPVSLGLSQPLKTFRLDVRDNGMRQAVLHVGWSLLWVGWQFVRQVSGDDAYERYLDHMTRAHPGQPAMGRTAYYKFCQEQKWNRVTRCC